MTTTKQYTNGQRVTCTCGGQHMGTIVHLMTADLLGVAWDDNNPRNPNIDPTFRKIHYKAGDTYSISASKITAA